LRDEAPLKTMKPTMCSGQLAWFIACALWAVDNGIACVYSSLAQLISRLISISITGSDCAVVQLYPCCRVCSCCWRYLCETILPAYHWIQHHGIKLVVRIGLVQLKPTGTVRLRLLWSCDPYCHVTAVNVSHLCYWLKLTTTSLRPRDYHLVAYRVVTQTYACPLVVSL